jgi:5-methylcytosine-specific restriction endonuclease McrA
MNNPRRQNGHRRNQTRAAVLARDTLCWLPTCRRPVDKTLPHGQDESPEVHELIAVSRGGSPYDLDNCVLTHRACNRWIGNRTPAEVLEAINGQQPRTITTLVAW